MRRAVVQENSTYQEAARRAETEGPQQVGNVVVLSLDEYTDLKQTRRDESETLSLEECQTSEDYAKYWKELVERKGPKAILLEGPGLDELELTRCRDV